MVEALLILALVGAGGALVADLGRRAARRRSRRRAEAVLDDLAARACAALAAGEGSAGARRAVARYARAGDRVARARTCRHLEAVVLEHRVRTGAERLLAVTAARLRAYAGRPVAPRR